MAVVDPEAGHPIRMSAELRAVLEPLRIVE
jgi:hypothetical protein